EWGSSGALTRRSRSCVSKSALAASTACLRSRRTTVRTLIAMRHLPFCTEYPARGFLFIGDPHVSSVRPGRRTDDYASSVLGKLEQAALIAHERRLVPVILGDLIHRDNESSVALITRLMAVLAKFPCVPLVLEGNHGKGKSRPSEGDVEYLLAQQHTIELMTQPG